MMDMDEERTYIIDCLRLGLTNEEIKEGRITDEMINHYRITIMGEEL